MTTSGSSDKSTGSVAAGSGGERRAARQGDRRDNWTVCRRDDRHR